MLAASLGDERWLDLIPRDRPAGILAEGVFEYMNVDDVRALLNRLTNHFAEGRDALSLGPRRKPPATAITTRPTPSRSRSVGI
jgi:O-methyltransferase involved in polyketide biosynthesis